MSENFVFLNESAEDDERDEERTSGNMSSLIDPMDDDYYAILNVPRDAEPDEIQNQYRKFSRIYHPDKHSQDADTKARAEQLFTKIKTAYEVLMDPQKRAVYDTLGTKGLDPDNNQGMELVCRYRTPMEIREEFERLQKEREERMLERKTNPKGQVTVNINASELFTPYEGLDEDDEYYDPDYYETGPYIELTGFHFYQSIEAPVTSNDTLTMSGSVSADNGRGKGNINFGWRKWLNHRAWGEAEVGGSTNGLEFGLKGWSQLGSRYFTNFHTGFQSTQDGIRPNLVLVLGSQLDSKSSATLTYRAGGLGGLQTQYTWEDSINRFVASFHLGVPHSYAGVHVSRRNEEKTIRYRAAIRGGTFGILAEYGIDKKVSPLTTLSATMALGIPIGVSLRIKVSRSNQIYVFPIQLSDQVLPAPVVYGTAVPLLAWLVVNKLLVEPYQREQEEKKKAVKKAQYKTRLAEKKQEAENAIKLMEFARSRIVSEEEAKGGLIITSGKYGRLGAVVSGSVVTSDEIIDVTIPLQILVKDSKLIIGEGSKSQIPGFYDPAPGEEKSLKIQYSFANKNHEVVFADVDPVRLPKDSHRTR